MGWFNRAEKCEGCKARLPEEARFCPECAQPVTDVYRTCPKDGCDGIATPWDAYCPRCGMTLPVVDEEVSFDLLWNQAPSQLARRYRVDTEKQAVEGTITVRYGQEALLLGDGGLLKTLAPGAHSIETTFRDLHVGAEGARRFEVVYLDMAEHTLDYSFAGFPSQDGVPVLADIRMAVEIRNPERMLHNFLKNAESSTKEGLRLRVRGEVRNAVEEGVARWPAEELSASRARKDELAGLILDHMRGTMEGLGFTLVRVETIDAKASALQEVQQQRIDRTLDRYTQQEEVARIGQDAELHEQKAEAWKRLRASLQGAEMSEVTDKTELRDFMRKLNQEQAEKDLIADSELDALSASVAYKKEDREKAREFLLFKLEQEQAYELERLQAKRRLAELETGIQAAKHAVAAKFEEASGDIRIDDLRDEADVRKEERRQKLRLTGLEEETRIATDAKIKDRESKLKTYTGMKQAKAEGAAMKLDAAGRAGLQADQLAALFAEEQPQLARALETAFAGRGSEEKAELERRHAQELREILEAARKQDAATMTSLIEQLAGSMGAAVSTRSAAGDREAEATRATVGMMSGASAPARKKCRVCHCEWMSDSNKCPDCGETFA